MPRAVLRHTVVARATLLAAVRRAAGPRHPTASKPGRATVAEFPGRFGWGYDGVDLYAPSHLYGAPDDLRAFVDRAHACCANFVSSAVCRCGRSRFTRAARASSSRSGSSSWHMQNTVHVTYRVLEGDGKVRLKLRPSVSFRPHEGVVLGAVPAEYSLNAAGGRYEISGPAPYPVLRLNICGECPAFTIDGHEVHNLVYRIERDPGYDHVGALWSPRGGDRATGAALHQRRSACSRGSRRRADPGGRSVPDHPRQPHGGCGSRAGGR